MKGNKHLKSFNEHQENLNMERLNEYLRNLSIESLMNLSRDSEGLTFDGNSIIRHLISEYGISSDFHTGLIGLRSILLNEITRRYFGSLK